MKKICGPIKKRKWRKFQHITKPYNFRIKQLFTRRAIWKLFQVIQVTWITLYNIKQRRTNETLQIAIVRLKVPNLNAIGIERYRVAKISITGETRPIDNDRQIEGGKKSALTGITKYSRPGCLIKREVVLSWSLATVIPAAWKVKILAWNWPRFAKALYGYRVVLAPLVID